MTYPICLQLKSYLLRYPHEVTHFPLKEQSTLGQAQCCEVAFGSITHLVVDDQFGAEWLTLQEGTQYRKALTR